MTHTGLFLVITSRNISDQCLEYTNGNGEKKCVRQRVTTSANRRRNGTESHTAKTLRLTPASPVTLRQQVVAQMTIFRRCTGFPVHQKKDLGVPVRPEDSRLVVTHASAVPRDVVINGGGVDEEDDDVEEVMKKTMKSKR